MIQPRSLLRSLLSRAAAVIARRLRPDRSVAAQECELPQTPVQKVYHAPAHAYLHHRQHHVASPHVVSAIEDSITHAMKMSGGTTALHSTDARAHKIKISVGVTAQSLPLPPGTVRVREIYQSLTA